MVGRLALPSQPGGSLTALGVLEVFAKETFDSHPGILGINGIWLSAHYLTQNEAEYWTARLVWVHEGLSLIHI